MEIENLGSQPKQNVPINLRWEIVHYKKQGLSGAQVSEIVGKDPSTCNRIYKKYLETGTVEDRLRSGRPSKVTPETEERFLTQVDATPNLSVNALLEESKVDFSKTTGLRVLRDKGYQCRVIPEKWYIEDKHRKARLAWAKKFIHKPEEYWFRVVFTDESRVQRNPKKELVWVSREIKINPIEFNRFQASLVVWGAIS